MAHLVRVAGLFGINDNRARVALSRMAVSGEVTTVGAGRYRLAGHLLDRQARQMLSRAGRTGSWSGSWHVVVLTGGATAAETRSQRRDALRRARLGELRQGVWMRPDNLTLSLDGLGGEDLVQLSARSPTDDASLASALWDLDAWSARARQLVGRLEALAPDGPRVLAPGFVLSAAVLRHLQADPLLPPALLPPDWPGEELRARYDEWDGRYRRILVEWTRAA